MVLAGIKPFRLMMFALSLVAIGCHAQTPPATPGALSVDLARRIEVLIRSRSDVPRGLQDRDGAKDEERRRGV